MQGHHTHSDQLHILFEANKKFAEVESIEQLVPILLSLAREVTHAEASSFLVFNHDRQTLRFANIKDETINNASRGSLKELIEIPMGEGIAGQVAQQKRPLIINDAQTNPLVYKKVDELTGSVTRSILAVPVLYKDELLGVIEAINPRDRTGFGSSDQDLLVSFSNLAAVAIIRARLLNERLHQQTISVQMETARKIQSLFSPKTPLPQNGSHAWAYTKPAEFVGGDLCDVIPMPDNSWLVYVADVSDKGLPAALIMAALWYRIRSEAHFFNDLCELLQGLNTSLYKLLSNEGYFVTIFIGRYWPHSGRLDFVNGGHPSALRVRENDCQAISGQRGFPLGIIDSTQYVATTTHLSPNEAIFFMTDGVTEAMNTESDLFGEQRIVHCLKNNQGPPWGQTLLNQIKAWQANSDQNDDLTILEIWRESV